MKRITTPLFYKILVGLLVLLVTSQGLASEYVLCVGEDGHATYEQSLGGKCKTAEPDCAADEISCNLSCTFEHCGTCQDYTTTFDSMLGRSRGEQDLSKLLPVSAAPAVTASAVPLFIRNLTANLSPLPPPQPSTALIILRSVVLLI